MKKAIKMNHFRFQNQTLFNCVVRTVVKQSLSFSIKARDIQFFFLAQILPKDAPLASRASRAQRSFRKYQEIIDYLTVKNTTLYKKATK
jgi:hypothetical protein